MADSKCSKQKLKIQTRNRKRLGLNSQQMSAKSLDSALTQNREQRASRLTADSVNLKTSTEEEENYRLLTRLRLKLKAQGSQNSGFDSGLTKRSKSN